MAGASTEPVAVTTEAAAIVWAKTVGARSDPVAVTTPGKVRIEIVGASTEPAAVMTPGKMSSSVPGPIAVPMAVTTPTTAGIRRALPPISARRRAPAWPS